MSEIKRGRRLLTGQLFEKALVEPVVKLGANRLYVVSGYATPAMAFHHINTLKEVGFNVDVELILGMCSSEGLSLSNHCGFKYLKENTFSRNFSCNYLLNPPPAHTKAYAWFKDTKPLVGFAGSANYTQIAFSGLQRETLVTCDPEECREYFLRLKDETIACDDVNVTRQLVIYDDVRFRYCHSMGKLNKTILDSESKFHLDDLPNVKISLLDRSGNLPQSSGLNWGQRPEYNREPNQAYIRVPMAIAQDGFFPPRTQRFTVRTDDGKAMICTVAQQNDKAIETPDNNSLIGKYFRNRLGLASGSRVQLSDLINYGRTDIDFYKIDNETYFMDFGLHR